MKNYKVQTESGACGLYNLANALRDESILNYDGEEDYIPCDNPVINKILRVGDYPYRIQSVLTSLSWKIKLPKTTVKQVLKSFSDTKYNFNHPLNVFIVYVQMGDTEFDLHAVTLMQCDGLLVYSDPHNSEFEKLDSIDEFFDKFRYVSSLNTFGNDDGFITFDATKYTDFEEYIN